MTARTEPADRIAVEDVIKRFCVAADRLDGELLATCFHPGAEVDLGPFLQGTVEDYLAMFASSDGPRSLDRTMHVVTNVLAELDGDVAHVESYCTAYHEGPAGHPWCDGHVVIGVRWLDRVEWRGGRWAIAARRAAFEWGRNATSGESMEFPPDYRGRRDRSDLRYR